MVSSKKGVLGPGPVAFLPNYTLKEKLAFGLSLSIFPRMLGTNLCLQGLSWLGYLWVATILCKGMITVFAMYKTPWGMSTALSNMEALSYDSTKADWFSVDGAPEDMQQKRSAGFAKLKQKLVGYLSKEELLMHGKVRKGNAQLRDDNGLQIVQPPFTNIASAQLPLTFLADRSEECFVYSGENKAMDVSGSYGVNVLGHDKTKELCKKGVEKMRALSPSVLGGCVHSVTCEVVEKVLKLCHLDEVSFHMCGTEALTAASKMARFNTGRRLIVKLGEGYHGWTECLQNPMTFNTWPKHLITINYGCACKFIQIRSSEIACVLFDPFISWAGLDDFPLKPSESLSRGADFKKHTEIYRQSEKTFAQQLRQVCTDNKVPLLIDEVWSGCKWSIPGSAQAYCEVRGDMVTYGKAIAGGMPCGIVCGRSWLMKRFQEDRPLGRPLIAGTFVASPLVLGVLAENLQWFLLESTRKQYEAQVKFQSEFFESLNNEFEKLELPFFFTCIDLFFRILVQAESGENFSWLFTYYCLAEGLGFNQTTYHMCQCTMEFKPEHYRLLSEKIKTAAQAFIEDGWNFEGTLDENFYNFRITFPELSPPESIPEWVNNLKEPLLA